MVLYWEIQDAIFMDMISIDNGKKLIKIIHNKYTVLKNSYLDLKIK